MGLASLAGVGGLSALVASRVFPAPHAAPPPSLSAPSAPPVAQSVPARAPVAQHCTLARAVVPGTAQPGGALALSPSEGTVAVADGDNDSVVLLALGSGRARVESRIHVGRRPAQVALGSDGRVFVTERGDNTVAVYDSASGALLCRQSVAADPVGIALSPDERTAYVTSGLSHTFTALDTATLAARAAVDVPREPRGVSLSRDGLRAFLAHIAGAPLSMVDLAASVPRAVPLPTAPVGTEFNAGTIRVSGEGWQPSRPVNPLPSQAFAAVVDPESGRVFVPFMVNRTGREVPPAVRVDAYGAGSVNGSSGEGEKVSFALGAFDPARGAWEGVSLPRAAVAFAGVGPRRARGLDEGLAQSTPVAGAPGEARAVRIPMAAAFDPRDHALVVASTGTASVASVALPTRAPRSNAPRAGAGLALPSGVAGVITGPVPLPASTAVRTEPSLAAPSGVAVTREGTVLVYSQVEHALEVRAKGAPAVRVSVAGDPLPADVSLGRRLFYAANEPRLSSGGLACAGCHPDGRDDGLTWFLSQGPRQTPTLAGRVTAPFNWNGTQRTMEGNVAQTVHRLGGSGLTMAEVDALSAFVQRGIFAPETPQHTPTPLEERGRALFAGAGGCVTCHDPGRNFTDGQAHELGGLGSDEAERTFDTPSLRYTAMTAPYFHDGRYATLRAVLTDPGHRMGHVELLSPTDVDAMAAYLETL